MAGHDETVNREERLDEIIASYLEGRGVEHTPEEIVARYPEFEKELERYFANVRDFIDLLPPPPEPPPHLGDDYEILQLIDMGGQACVYKAHQKSLNKTVAIKVPRQCSLASNPEGIRKEAQRAASLRHPHIVPVHHVGEHEGQQFCVMEFIEGQNLAMRIERGPLSPADAAQYVKTIAEAIHYAHQRELLHCDLKPRNILLDEDGKPYVADFGLAKRLGVGGRYRWSSSVGGTPGYMAPELASGGELTTATDVYGLGAILYALLTATEPFRGETVQRTLELVRGSAPVPPRHRNPEVDQDLEAICLKCLRKNPDERYASAYGLARDIERYENGDETTARMWRHGERAAGWYRRNPALAGTITAVALISVLTAVVALSIAHARRQAQMEEALRSNTSVARALANTALLQLRDWARIVEVAVADATLPELLRTNDRAGLQRYVELVCGGAPGVCASCGVRDSMGFSVARIGDGTSDPSTGVSSQRDYFHGAWAHGEFAGRQSVHISKVYVSTVDRLHKFAISAPIRDRSGQSLGVLLMSVTTDAALGLVNFPDARRKVALIAPLDGFDPHTNLIDRDARHLILFHPAYRRGGPAIDFPPQLPIASYAEPVHFRELDDSNHNLLPNGHYEDPVGGSFPEYKGSWIAGFAPVGNTSFFVVVQQRVDDALKVDPFISWNMAIGVALVIGVFIAATVALLHRSRHAASRLVIP